MHSSVAGADVHAWPRCAGSNWVDPPKRERKRVVNYAENEYFRQAMKAGGGAGRGGGPRLPKMPQLQARARALSVATYLSGFCLGYVLS